MLIRPCHLSDTQQSDKLSMSNTCCNTPTTRSALHTPQQCRQLEADHQHDTISLLSTTQALSDGQLEGLQLSEPAWL